MNTEMTEAEKIRRLPWLVGGDTFNIMFVLLTFSGSVFILFLDDIGLDTAQIGFLLALVPFCGVLAPLVAPISNRFGYKRVFVSMRGLRNIPMALLIATPIVLRQYGEYGAFLWVSSIIFTFAIMRAIGETGGFSWRKEIVPDSIRGKFSATSSMTTTVASILIILVAGFVIDQGSGLGRFVLLISFGVLSGFLSVLFFARAPGDNRQAARAANTGHFAEMRGAVRDRGFLMFLLVLSLATIGSQVTMSFIPLFMKEEVGIPEGIVVLLSIGTYIGALFTSYFWGWAADRYSSKPVMQVSLILMILLPVSYMMLPRYTAASIALAMAIAFVAGIATLAWQISWTRYLYVNAIPGQKRAAYLAVYFAWFSVVVGTGPLISGRILEWTVFIPTMQIGLIYIDAYTPLFILSVILLASTMLVVPRLKAEGDVTLRRFAGMFLRGNPVRAMRLLIQYNQSGDEMTRVITTERMGDTRNLLNSEELIEALHDPSHNVRYEAIHSIGRMPGTSELRDALIEMLEGPEAELGMSTARALGRLGDPVAAPALRRSLQSRYDLIAAESARALAQLDDVESIPVLVKKMSTEPNKQLKVAYASALGKLHAEEQLPELFALLCEAETNAERGEVGLAIARIIGDEKYYLQQWRSLQSNFDTATAQALMALRKSAKKAEMPATEALLEICANCFAASESQDAIDQLRRLLENVAGDESKPALREALLRCAAALDQCGSDRLDLTLLALHALDTALNQEPQDPT